MRIFALAAVTALMAPAIAYGQSINIDFAAQSGTPSNSFAGAAQSAGFWNNLGDGSAGTYASLLNVSSAVTNVSLTVGTAGFTGSVSPTAGVSGAPEALLDDYMWSSTTQLWLTVQNLASGHYAIYTYTVGHQDFIAASQVWINGLIDTAQQNSGVWGGDFELNVSHSRHFAFISDGMLRIDITSPSDAFVNGIQIVEIPAPSTFAVVGGGVWMGVPRRRRANGAPCRNHT